MTIITIVVAQGICLEMGGILVKAMCDKEDEALMERLGMTRKQIDLVVDSWPEIKKFGTEKAGIVLFVRFFKVAPDTFSMFEDFKNIKEWEQSPEFRHHCKIVMNIVGSAVGLLKDPDSLESTLEYLGLKHDGFAITEKHFDLMGVELIETLRAAMGAKLTPELIDAWLAMYKYIVKIILMGMAQMEGGVKKIAADA